VEPALSDGWGAEDNRQERETSERFDVVSVAKVGGGGIQEVVMLFVELILLPVAVASLAFGLFLTAAL
jgi:hypothetical protein